MKKSKILVSALSLTALAPVMPVALTSCNKDSKESFTPTITKDTNVTEVLCSNTKLNTAFSVSCTVKEGFKVDPTTTVVKIGGKTLTNEEDYVIYDNIIIVASAPVTSKDVQINIKTKDVATKYNVSLFCGAGGKLEGGQTSLEVVAGTQWKDIANKPTPVALDGYKFVGWYRNENKIEDGTTITANMDIYAWFEKEAASQVYVTVIAGPGGKIGAGSDTSIILPIQSGTKWGNIKEYVKAEPTSTSYVFDNWYMNDKVIDDDTPITENSYVFAWFLNSTETKCTLKFVEMTGGFFASGQTAKITQIIDKGTKWSDITKPTLADPENGFVFENWYIDNEVPTEDTVINDTVYCFAYFEKAEATVTIDTNVEHGTVITDTKKLPVGTLNHLRTELDKLVKPEPGYVLNGWDDEEGNRILDNYRIDTDKKIKPVFIEECNEYQYDDVNHYAYIKKRISGKDQANLMIPAYIWKDGEVDPYMIKGFIFDASTGYYDGSSTLNIASIPETITVIQDRTFRNCPNLNTVILPATITNLKYQCFYQANYRSNLTNFRYLGTVNNFAAVAKSGYWSDGVKTRSMICIDGVASI